MVSKNKVGRLTSLISVSSLCIYFQINISGFSVYGLYRNVAKFLEKTFLEQREKGEEEKASLLELCRGRTQKESARLFYETLVCHT